MANSIKEYIAGTNPDGTTYTVSAAYNYTTPDYLTGRGATDIKVYVGGELQPTSDYVLSGTSLNFLNTALPTAGQTIRIERNSNQEARLTDYTEGALLTAETLDADATQIFHVAQEAYDQSRVTNTAAGKFYYSQTDEPENPVVGTLWYNLNKTPNILEIYDGEGWYPAAPLKHTTTYSQSDFIALGGGNAVLRNVTFNTSTELYLNGVKLVQGQVFADLAADADFYYDTSQTPQIVMPELSADDTLDVVTFTGGYSENTQQQIDALTAALPDMNAVLDLNLAVNQPIIEAAAETATQQAAIATQKAGETTDPLNGWFAIDNESIKTSNVGDPVIYSTGNYKIKAEDEIELEGSGVKVNGMPLPFIQGVITLGTSTWQGTSGVTVARRFPSIANDNRYVLGGVLGLSNPDDVYVQATYNYDGEFTDTTCTLAIQPIANNINVAVLKTEADGTKSNISSGRVVIQVYKI